MLRESSIHLGIVGNQFCSENGNNYMIKKTDSCRYLYFLLHIRGWGIVEINGHLDLCFVCFAGDGGLSGHRCKQGATTKSIITCMLSRARLLPAVPHGLIRRPPATTRHIFNIFNRSSRPKSPQEPLPLLTEDNLFHPFSKSPFPAVRARGEAIQSLAPCPVCTSSHNRLHPHTQAQPRAVRFECPDCGWPTHCSEEHRNQDIEHQKYCARLQEANEDEHDLRSGRRMREFELPGM